MAITSVVGQTWRSFSFVGLAIGTVCFAASLSPSLLPRHFAVQGLLSGLAMAVGYGVGVFFVWLWLYLEIPQPSEQIQRVSKFITAACVAGIAIGFLWRATIWQNSIRALMGMEPVASAHAMRVALIAAVTAGVLVWIVRGMIRCGQFLHQRVNRFIPRRVSYVVSAVIVVTAIFLVANKVITRLALNAADRVFLRMDQLMDDTTPAPAVDEATGSDASLVAWDTIGRQGRNFIANGPTLEQIGTFHKMEAQRPIRVYVGLATRDTEEERAALAVKELIRVGGFDRSVLVIATPTGTGWLDPGAVDSLEYIHQGDTAIVSMQYSYLPSWITILVDPARSRESARALFDAVYEHWRSLPRDRRPKLYVHGLSLGALGSSASADLFTIFEDPIDGGVWSGPPFASSNWARATRYRNPDSPMWLPTFRDSSLLRFTGRESTLDRDGKPWGRMRFVYIQHASDPMTFFSPTLLYRRPAWLVGERGRDVSPYLRWYPLVTFLQLAFDLPMATNVPVGYGHNIAPSSYIDAWVAVTQPRSWTNSHTQRLKQLFATKPNTGPKLSP